MVATSDLTAEDELGSDFGKIPVLDTKGDVYKTEGANDPLIYDSTIGHK